MTSSAQIAANIANAQHSTGPVTSEGKARAAANSLKLGIYAQQAVLLSDEDRSAFATLEQSYKSELMAESAIELTLFGLIILSAWNIQRAGRLEATLAKTEGVDPLLSTNPTAKKIVAFRLRAERSFHKNLSEYRKLKKAEAEQSKEQIKLTEIRKNEPNFNAPFRTPSVYPTPKSPIPVSKEHALFAEPMHSRAPSAPECATPEVSCLVISIA